MNACKTSQFNLPATLDPLVQQALLACKDSDPIAAEKLLLHNLRLVCLIANELRPRTSLGLDELISHGYQGLVESVHSFDPRRDVGFVWWAATKIRMAIQRGIVEDRPGNRLTYDQHREVWKIKAAAARLRNEFGREPDAGLIAEELGIQEKTVANWQRLAKPWKSVETTAAEPNSEDLDSQAMSVLDSAGNPAERLAHADAMKEIKRFCQQLSQSDRTILQSYYNLGESQSCGMTDAEIACRLHCHPETVRVRRQKILQQLRQWLNQKPLPIVRSARRISLISRAL